MVEGCTGGTRNDNTRRLPSLFDTFEACYDSRTTDSHRRAKRNIDFTSMSLVIERHGTAGKTGEEAIRNDGSTFVTDSRRIFVSKRMDPIAIG